MSARALAIDFGERRIGLALSDPTATVALPLPAITRRRGKRPPIKTLLELIADHGVDRIVVGLPLSLEATDTEWTTAVRTFATRLQERADLPVYMLDERMTSVIAERMVRSIGLSRTERERKDRVDTAAAQLILQAFLDREKSGHPLEPAASRSARDPAAQDGTAHAPETAVTDGGDVSIRVLVESSEDDAD